MFVQEFDSANSAYDENISSLEYKLNFTKLLIENKRDSLDKNLGRLENIIMKINDILYNIKTNILDTSSHDCVQNKNKCKCMSDEDLQRIIELSCQI